jgi:SAM-dependent methyltransferase
VSRDRSVSGGGAFGQYAGWYDAFNPQKDYVREAEYLMSQVERWRPRPKCWLDLGCGTGRHLACLRGLGVAGEGLDLSPAMIAQARANNPGIDFHVGAAEELALAGQRDVISMLFHALCYITSDALLRQALDRIRERLSPSGLFLFDFWNTEAVAVEPPGPRTRDALIGGRRLVRLTTPVARSGHAIIDVQFEFRWDNAEGEVVHRENHPVRHFSATELQQCLRKAEFAILTCEAWQQHRPLTPADWYGFICAAPTVARSNDSKEPDQQ